MKKKTILFIAAFTFAIGAAIATTSKVTNGDPEGFQNIAGTCTDIGAATGCGSGNQTCVINGQNVYNSSACSTLLKHP